MRLASRDEALPHVTLADGSVDVEDLRITRSLTPRPPVAFAKTRVCISAFACSADAAAVLAGGGLGTAPALLGVSVADELLARHRTFVNRLSQVFLLAMGIWFLWTGYAVRVDSASR